MPGDIVRQGQRLPPESPSILLERPMGSTIIITIITIITLPKARKASFWRQAWASVRPLRAQLRTRSRQGHPWADPLFPGQRRASGK